MPRPKGASNFPVQHTEAPKSRCAQCNSTQRSPYISKIEQRIVGVEAGKPYNLIIWRRTSCENCGQHRIDKSFEYVPEPPQKKKSAATKSRKNKPI